MCEDPSENCFGKPQKKAQGGGDIIAVSKAQQSIQKEKTEPDHCQVAHVKF